MHLKDLHLINAVLLYSLTAKLDSFALIWKAGIKRQWIFAA